MPAQQKALVERYPQLVASWCFQQNLPLTVDSLVHSFNKYYFFCRDCSVAKLVTLANISRKGYTLCSDCQKQSKMLPAKEVSFAAVYPEAQELWHPDNTDTPFDVYPQSHQTRKFHIYTEDGQEHVWNTQVRVVYIGRRCPCDRCTCKLRETSYEKETGFTHPTKNPEVIQARKRKYASLHGGMEHPTQNPDVKEKMRMTNQLRRNVDYPSQDPNVVKKAKATFMQRTGFENSSKNPESVKKRKKTNLLRFGFENPFSSAAMQEKIKQSHIKKRGVPHPSQDPIVRAKTEATNMERRGVPHPMQDLEIFERALHNARQWHTFTFPSGKTVRYQGYEHFCIRDLLLLHAEDEIILHSSAMPTVWYEYLGGRHRYYPDIYIPSQHRLIEVKHNQWRTSHHAPATVVPKLLAAQAAGFQVELWEYKKKKGEGVLVRKTVYPCIVKR